MPLLQLPNLVKSGRPRAWFKPRVETLEERTALTAFTLTSPTQSGALPDGVTAVGGIVLDLIGTNGRRVVSQLSARSLFQGFFDRGAPIEFQGNPGTIGIQVGFTPQVVNALGGGIRQMAVRLTLFDGDTSAGAFDFGDNVLLLNGLSLGNLSSILTEETSEDGETSLSDNPEGGFRNERLDTGFFLSNDPELLAAFHESLVRNGQVTYQLQDADPFDNFFDFTLGVEGDLIDSGRPPAVVNAPPRITLVINDGPVIAGRLATVTVTAVDPDGPGQPLTFEFDFDNDGTFETSNTSGTAQGAFVTAGSYMVRVRVLDANGGQDVGTITVVVTEAPPPDPGTPPEVIPESVDDDSQLLIALVDAGLAIATDPAAGPRGGILDRTRDPCPRE